MSRVSECLCRTRRCKHPEVKTIGRCASGCCDYVQCLFCDEKFRIKVLPAGGNGCGALLVKDPAQV